MPEDLLYWLDQIQSSHRRWVGDKALYLAMLMQRGYPVVPGFVISATGFQAFLEQIHWIEPLFADLPYSSLHLDVDNPRQLQTIAQQIRSAIQTTSIPAQWLEAITAAAQRWNQPLLILRPSFSLPTALDPSLSHRTLGLLQSYICVNTPASIAPVLQQVWAELFRAKSLVYWQRLGIQIQQIHLAVLVQPLQIALAAGELQPYTNGLEIRSVWGLGHGLVRGEVSPDLDRYNYQSHQLSRLAVPKTHAYQATHIPPAAPLLQLNPIDLHHTTQPVLSPDQVQHLIHSAQQIVAELGTPFHLEWILQPGSETSALRFTQATPELLVPINPSIEPSVQHSAPSHSAPSHSAPSHSAPSHSAPSHSAPSHSPHLNYPSLPHSQTPPLVPTHLAGLSEATTSSDEAITSHEIASHEIASHEIASHEAISHEAISHEATANIPTLARPSQLTGLAVSPGTALASVWIIDTLPAATAEIPSGSIVVAPMITPASLVRMKHVVGIITEQGGATSHGAILAREMGIPAVVGVNQATQHLQTGDRVLLDGNRGEIHRLEPSAGSSSADVSPIHPSATTSAPRLPIATQLFLTLNQADRLADLARLPSDGVGLLRSELLFLESVQQDSKIWFQSPAPLRFPPDSPAELPDSPAELIDRIAQVIQQVAQAFHPRSVFYRSLDLRSHEFALPLDVTLPEANPMLGLRGVARYPVQPTSFDIELAALKQVQQAGWSNVNLLLPFVRTIEEFLFCRDAIDRVNLRADPGFQVWIMAEVPSVLVLLPDYVAVGVQGVAIGSNDLTQLILGVDRDQPQINPLFNAKHPAVLRAMQQIIQMANQLNIPCSICGQATVQYPELIDALIRWGITAISVEPNAIELTYQAIVRAEQRLIVEAARQALRTEPL